MEFKKQSVKKHSTVKKYENNIDPLTEGYYYPFKISNIKTLPGGIEYFILTDVNGVKHLLEKKPYSDYNFHIDQIINCRIDKINCTGKIFIEPEHPHYRPGEKFPFVFNEYRAAGRNNYLDQKAAVFKDVFDNDIIIPANEIPEKLIPGQEVRAVVEKIKRGKVYINFDQFINDFSGFKANNTYSFTVEGEVTTGGGYDFYVLRDVSGKEFRLRRKFYRKYGFDKGSTIRCRVIKNANEAYLEPEHPYYKIGKRYPFLIIGSTTVFEYPDVRKKALLLENRFGKDIVIKEENIQNGWKKNSARLDCKVLDIQKSQLKLSC